MTSKIEIKKVEPLIIAAVREVIPYFELGIKIPLLLNIVYEFFKFSGINDFGHNLALYLDNKPTVEVGVQVFSEFENSGNLICSKIPGGTVVCTIHTGPYHNLPDAHKKIHEWCNENGKTFAGPCWEIYDDWNDDPSKLITEVFYLLDS